MVTRARNPGNALLVVRASSAAEIVERLARDPWTAGGLISEPPPATDREVPVFTQIGDARSAFDRPTALRCRTPAREISCVPLARQGTIFAGGRRARMRSRAS